MNPTKLKINKLLLSIFIIVLAGAGIYFVFRHKGIDKVDQQAVRIDTTGETKASAGLSADELQKICSGIEQGNVPYKPDIPLPVTCAINIGHNTKVSLNVDERSTITVSKDGEEIFTHTDEEQGGSYDLASLNPPYVNFYDVTFDGYSDIVINTFSGAYNFGYTYFAYDPETGEYDPEPILEDIVNPDFYAEGKTIDSHQKGRGLNDTYIDNLYKFQDGGYVLIRTEVQDTVDSNDLSKGYTNTVYELKNGKMIQTYKTHLSEEDVLENN